jgi:hypothetical protein
MATFPTDTWILVLMDKLITDEKYAQCSPWDLFHQFNHCQDRAIPFDLLD